MKLLCEDENILYTLCSSFSEYHFMEWCYVSLYLLKMIIRWSSRVRKNVQVWIHLKSSNDSNQTENIPKAILHEEITRIKYVLICLFKCHFPTAMEQRRSIPCAKQLADTAFISPAVILKSIWIWLEWWNWIPSMSFIISLAY